MLETDLCSVCGGAAEHNFIKNKLTYTCASLQTSLGALLGEGIYQAVCHLCYALIDRIDFLQLEIKLKLSELKTIFSQTLRKISLNTKPSPVRCRGKKEKVKLPKLPCKLCLKLLTERGLEKHRKICIAQQNNKLVSPSVPADNVLVESNIEQFKCELCDKTFRRQSDCKNHIRIHTGDKPFQCEECGFRFNQKQNLRTHMRIKHLKEKRYECVECDKKFTRKRLLDGHMNSKHNQTRPYQCQFCQARFCYPDHVRKHEAKSCRAHKKQCVQCKKFVHQSSLESHICRSIEGGKRDKIKKTENKEGQLKISSSQVILCVPDQESLLKLYQIGEQGTPGARNMVKISEDQIQNCEVLIDSIKEDCIAVVEEEVVMIEEKVDPQAGVKEKVENPQVEIKDRSAEFEVDNAVFSIVQSSVY